MVGLLQCQGWRLQLRPSSMFSPWLLSVRGDRAQTLISPHKVFLSAITISCSLSDALHTATHRPAPTLHLTASKETTFD